VSPAELVSALAVDAPRHVARAITVVERGGEEAGRLVALPPPRGRRNLVGITGAPGAGKSTLTSALISQLRRRGLTVGVLAVDPSSPFSGGAVLGDRIRMTDHAGDPGVFIRSMATRGRYGGLAPATLDAARVLGAAGFDRVLVETVGVGQSEVEIMNIADLVLLVLTPGAGDGVQAMKAGIMEIGDLFVLNKADQPAIDRLERDVRDYLSYARHDRHPLLCRTNAVGGQGLPELAELVERLLKETT